MTNLMSFFSDGARQRALARGLAGAASLLFHGVLIFILFRNEGQSGAPWPLPVVIVELLDGRELVREDPARKPIPESTWVSTPNARETSQSATQDSPSPATESKAPEQRPAESSDATATDASALLSELDEPAALDSAAAIDNIEPVEPDLQPLAISESPPEPRKVEIPQAVQTLLAQRIAKGAEALTADATRSEFTWQENGQSYTAVLSREAIADSMHLEHVVADITTSGQGTSLHTRMRMKRLAFSQFTQVVDRWDRDVQLHDDEIVGRFHSNSPFYLGYDAKAAPKFLGKVTMAGRGFRVANAHSSRRRDEIFQGGLETGTGRIELPDLAQPFSTEPVDENAHVFRVTEDARITFHAGASYVWEGRKSNTVEHRTYPAAHPAYFIAARDVTLHVKGTISGRVLVYSPEGIVIDGSLVYAHNPRTDSDSPDYLGLVCDEDVDVARPGITGPGDLKIEAAIFARRRFNVADIEHRRTATLVIYGSLTAGTLSATEPRYATRIEFDPRFDRVRPPGFPGTNRYEVAESAGQWTQVSATLP